MIAVISVPAITSLSSTGQFSQATFDLASLLEQSREYAISQNTYVWVGINANTSENTVTVSVVASKEGTNLVDVSSNLGLAPSTTLDLVRRITTYKQVSLKEAGDTDLLSNFRTQLSPSATAANSLGNAMSFSVKLPGNNNPTVFSRLLEFTPRGEARNGSNPINLVEFGLKPSTPNTHNVAVVRVNGMTGLTQVYRP